MIIQQNNFKYIINSYKSLISSDTTIQLINQSINQLYNPISISIKSINSANVQTLKRSVNRLYNQFNHQSINQSVNQSINQPTNQLMFSSINQSIINKPPSPPVKSAYWVWSLVLIVSRGKRVTSTAVPAQPPSTLFITFFNFIFPFFAYFYDKTWWSI